MANENMIKFLRGNVANLPQTATSGALYFTKDEGIYLGMEDGSYHRYGDFITVADVNSLPTAGAHATCMYYCTAENILARYDSAKGWVQINKQPTAEELKTLLGLGTLAYKSEVVEGDLNAALVEKINASAEGNHSHSNKTVLDGITAEKVTAWDAAEGNAKTYADGLNTAMNTRVEALEAIDHEHANKALLDTYTQTEANLADAVAKKHSHTFNETELNKIVEGDVAKWNAAEKNAKDYADGLDGAMNTRVEALETAIGENGSVATQIKTAIEALDFTDVAVDGEYVSAVNEVDGKISVTRKALPDYSNTYDAKGAADTAFENAKAYADGLAANYDEKGAAAGVKTELEAEIAKKVDKVDGKSLVSDTEITKLAGVSEGANKVEASANNGSIKIDGVETVVYTHPASHTVSEISDFDEKVKAYDYATKTDAQAMADGKDEAIAAAKKAGDDAQDTIDAYIESNNTALAGVKATAEAAAVKTEVETALADRYTKSEADGKFAVKGEDSYDDTVLAGRVTAAEGKITALEGASATHATKDELNAVDAKFADYNTTVAQKAIDDAQDARIKAIEDDYVVAADIANFETKENVKKVADDLAAYVESNDAALAAETKARTDADADFETRIAALEDNFGDGEGTVEAQIEAAVAAEKQRAEGIEGGLRTDVDVIKGDYLKAADKTELEGKITTNANAIERLTNGVSAEEIDGVNDLIKYVNEHGTEVTGMKEDIAANAKAIEDHETLAAQTYETKEDASAKLTEAKGYTDTEVAKDRERLATLEAIDHDAYVAADAALKTELEGKIADGDAATLEAAKTDAANKDAVVLAESQKYTDAAKAEAIADAEGKVNALAEGAVATNAGNIETLFEMFQWGEF